MTQKLVTSAPAQVRAVSGRPETAATLMEVWQGLSAAVVDTIADDWYATEQKYSAGRQEHYFSAEFLMGRALLNNLSNLGMIDEAREAVGSLGVNLSDVLEALTRAGVTCGRITSEPPTLNDVFLEITGRALRDEAA